MTLSTHVLDAGIGRPAAGMSVRLERQTGEVWSLRFEANTDHDGRIATFGEVDEGVYRLRFDTASYFSARDLSAFYPEVSVCFEITDPGQHYHVPLLLSPFAYSTYRGS